RRAASSATSSGVYGASSPSSTVTSDLRAPNRTAGPVDCVAPWSGAGGGAPGRGATGVIAGGTGRPGGAGDAGGADGVLPSDGFTLQRGSPLSEGSALSEGSPLSEG